MKKRDSALLCSALLCSALLISKAWAQEAAPSGDDAPAPWHARYNEGASFTPYTTYKADASFLNLDAPQKNADGSVRPGTGGRVVLNCTQNNIHVHRKEFRRETELEYLKHYAASPSSDGHLTARGQAKQQEYRNQSEDDYMYRELVQAQGVSRSIQFECTTSNPAASTTAAASEGSTQNNYIEVLTWFAHLLDNQAQQLRSTIDTSAKPRSSGQYINAIVIGRDNDDTLHRRLTHNKVRENKVILDGAAPDSSSDTLSRRYHNLSTVITEETQLPWESPRDRARRFGEGADLFQKPDADGLQHTWWRRLKLQPLRHANTSIFVDRTMAYNVPDGGDDISLAEKQLHTRDHGPVYTFSYTSVSNGDDDAPSLDAQVECRVHEPETQRSSRDGYVKAAIRIGTIEGTSTYRLSITCQRTR